MAFVTIDDSLEIKEQTKDKVIFEIKGETAQPTRIGGEEYHNVETREIEVSRERAEYIANRILEESD